MASDYEKSLFLETLWSYYGSYGRHELPWRETGEDGNINPYHVLVSELMLQQTQVNRVIPKYALFLSTFPTIPLLASAELGDVLRVWQGLGYNRRAKFLWQSAGDVASLPVFPTELQELVKLPGIGINTAGALKAYAFNEPVIFVETNIRTVYIHHFFAGATEVSDKEIRDVLELTLDREHPREFYWALMDYGTHLKSSVGNLSKISKHYVKQSAFTGSRRQVRGKIIRLLGDRPRSIKELQAQITDERLHAVLAELVGEGLIRARRGVYAL